MIICPLNAVKCTRLIIPKVKTAFIMAPSSRYQTTDTKRILSNITNTLSSHNYTIQEGSNIVRHGDYFCSICQNTQGCALGVAIIYDALPIRTISNIYMEAGMMLSFGKPVVLFVDKRKNLPSDYIRHYAIFFNSKGYLSKWTDLLGHITRLPEDLYEHVGDLALRAKDFEKAAKYFQESYLLNPKQKTFKKLKSIMSELEQSDSIPKAYKQRLIENIQFFCSKAKYTNVI